MTPPLPKQTVKQLIAGPGVKLSPPDGVGVVTITSTAVSTGGGGAAGVAQLVAGTGITLTPSGGTGVVTISAPGSGVIIDTNAAHIQAVGSAAGAGGIGEAADSGHVHVGVASFNGRTAAVTPTGGDYTAAQVGALPTTLLATAGDLIYENATPTPATLPIGSSGKVLTVVGGLPAWAAPGGSATTLFPISAYLFQFDGTNYHLYLPTGVDAYTPSTNATTFANHMVALLNASTTTNSTTIFVDQSINLSGISSNTISGQGWQVIGYGGGGSSLNPNTFPNLGLITVGNTGAANLVNCTWENVAFENLVYTTVNSTGGFISDIRHHNTYYRAESAAHLIEIHLSGVTASGIQYLSWTGKTTIALPGSGGSTSVNDFFYVTGTASTASLGHSFFEYIEQVGGTFSGTFALFNLDNGTKWHRIEATVIDLNTNKLGGQAYTPTVINFVGGANTTKCPGIWIGALHWEQHNNTGTAAIVTCGNFTGAAVIQTDIKIENVYLDAGVFAAFMNGGGAFGTAAGFFLDIDSIGGSGSNNMIAGTWIEDPTCPIRIGRCFGMASPLNTGNIISTPVSSASTPTLSIAGTSSTWVAATTYTCGGTAMGVYIASATVTLTASDGTAIFTAQALTNETFVLSQGMQIKSSVKPVFWKAE